MVEHRSLVNYLCWVDEGSMGDALAHVPLTTKLTFDMCLKQLFPSLLRGGKCGCCRTTSRPSPRRCSRHLVHGPEVGLNCVPSLGRPCYTQLIEVELQVRTKASRIVLFGGEQLSQDLSRVSCRVARISRSGISTARPRPPPTLCRQK